MHHNVTSTTSLSDPATDAAFAAIMVGTFDHDALTRLLANCDRDIAAETARELAIPVPDCAREGWTP